MTKRCLKALKWLHGQLRLAWKNGHISKECMKADGVYIPKEKDSEGISQFRPISLLNVEGKIFFSVMASRLMSYLLTNGYVDTIVQKGGVPGIVGCLEHGSMILKAVQKAKEGKRNLDVIWLDLANANGLVPHQMIQMVLLMCHVPKEICLMLHAYFEGFQMGFSTDEYTTDWVTPSVSEEAVKSLGRWHDETLKDTRQSKEKALSTDSGLKKIDRSPLPGRHRVWCLQHMLTSMLLWPLLVYEIATSAVEAMEAKINKFTRKWLAVPPGLSDVALYCRQVKLRLPLKTLVEEYKAGKTMLRVMLENSQDEVVRSVQLTLRTGRKWKVLDAVMDAKDNLRLKEVIGHIQAGRQRLGGEKRL
ncbi:uncharacterized protein LOC101856396 [Aplysia californica]|uniref:Uncharacterized protein LOC101856396 n=1 Tax=Aplysia californica TaxID=6500 RepID=A0ABM0KAB9_APLCA|nr:uncharacterized protein LOC101856396 [Aplysia californica]